MEIENFNVLIIIKKRVGTSKKKEKGLGTSKKKEKGLGGRVRLT